MRRPARPTLLALALCACGPARPPITVDLVAPYVLGVEPSGNTVAVDATFHLRFSEPVRREKLFWTDPATTRENPDSVLLAAAEDEDDLVSAANSPPLSASQRAKTVPATVTLSADRATVDLAPAQRLEGLKSYVIVVSRKVVDDHSNGLVTPDTKVNETQVVRFTTAGAPDTTRPTATLKAPSAGAGGVSIDVHEVDVQFSEPMDKATVTSAHVGLVELAGQLSIAPADIKWIENVAALELPPNAGAGCVTLCPGKAYALFVDGAVRDLAGNALEPVDAAVQRFTAATCADAAPPQLAAATLHAEPTDRSAVVTWKTDEPSTSVVRFETCGAGPCPPAAAGDDASCTADVCHLPTDQATFGCGHSVRLTGLWAATAYTVRLVSKDGGGRETVSPALTFTTLAALPRLVLNELFATPVDGAGKSDSDQKYVELYNAGSEAVDLTPTGTGSTRRAWALARCADATCTGAMSNVWPMKPAGASGLLAPGGHALAAGNAFDPAKLGVGAAVLVLHNDGTSTTVLSTGLTTTSAYAFALLAPGGIVVSTYGAFLGLPNAKTANGHSFERKDAQGEDAAANWAVSTAAVSGAPGNFATPGTKNSVSP